MLEKFSHKGFVKVSDNPHIKVLATALFSSNLVHYRKIITTSYCCNVFLHHKGTSSFVWKNQTVTSFNSSRHKHMFPGFCIELVLAIT